MNGFADHGLDEGAFGEKKGLSEGIRSFDAFRKSTIYFVVLPKHSLLFLLSSKYRTPLSPIAPLPQLHHS